MEWTDESMTRLRSLWQEGLSTAEIGRRMQITKNAVVGKAHRLALSARPSPIRKLDPMTTTALVSPVSVVGAPAPVEVAPIATMPEVRVPDVSVDPVPAGIAEVEAVVVAEPVQRLPVPGPTVRSLPEPDNVHVLRPEIGSPEPVRPAPVARVRQEPLRAVEAVAPRRRGLTCCWPLGEPGTKEFHFCGGEPTPGKPYCTEHAALAYVKLRDRRDSVA